MSLRLIKVFCPEVSGESVRQVLEEQRVLGVWQESLDDDMIELQVLLEVDETESLLDRICQPHLGDERFRVLLLSVQATLPRPESPAAECVDDEVCEPAVEEPKTSRISREELFTSISETTKLSTTYLMLIVVSAIVAAVGLMRNNVAEIIGAMVIAPLLGPIAAMALATTLADGELARRAFRTGIVGLAIAFTLACAIGVVFGVDPATSAIAQRTHLGLGDLVLALASGVAGALAFTAGAPSALVGVMVAVALIPPLVTAGLLSGIGDWSGAWGALLLHSANVICVNLAGVLTFVATGIRPANWWEAKRAKQATRKAILMSSVLLILLVIAIVLSRQTK